MARRSSKQYLRLSRRFCSAALCDVRRDSSPPLDFIDEIQASRSALLRPLGKMLLSDPGLCGASAKATDLVAAGGDSSSLLLLLEAGRRFGSELALALLLCPRLLSVGFGLIPMTLLGVMGLPLGGGISMGDGVDAPFSLDDASVDFATFLVADFEDDDCSPDFASCNAAVDEPGSIVALFGLAVLPDDDSVRFRCEGGAEVGLVTGLIRGLGRALFARASAVVLRFFRGTLFVGCGPAGLAFGVCRPIRARFRAGVGP